jgi:predicted RNase H-like HicB family nuclease
MAPAILENKSNNSLSFIFDSVDWAYSCHICLVPEEGQVSAIVLNLPGAASCGATEAEALANVEESIRGLIELYEERGEPIPWREYGSDEIPAGAKTRWILVNV